MFLSEMSTITSVCTDIHGCLKLNYNNFADFHLAIPTGQNLFVNYICPCLNANGILKCNVEEQRQSRKGTLVLGALQTLGLLQAVKKRRSVGDVYSR